MQVREQEIDMELVNKIKELKKAFKSLSKNQLIAYLIQQMVLVAEHQNANKVLFEENKQLKEEKKEEKGEKDA